MPATYELLPSDATSTGPTDEPASLAYARKWSITEAIFTSLLVVFLIACTVSNAILLYHAQSSTPKVSRTTLRRPTTYMGLWEVPWSTTDGTAQNFSNFPFLLTQISPTFPMRVWPDDTARRMTEIGTISPDGRNFKISPDVSSVLQFRTVDFGYERCTIEIALKDPGSVGAINISHPTNPIAVDVWRLDSPTKIDVRQLSWATRPPRSSHLGTSLLEWGQTIRLNSSFVCPWGTYQTFEISCSESTGKEYSPCEMDFWQDPKVPQRYDEADVISCILTGRCVAVTCSLKHGVDRSGVNARARF